MLPQRRHHIRKRAVSRIGTFLFNGFTKLCLESLLAFFLHLYLGKCFFLTAGVFAVIGFTDGMCQTSLHALLSEKYRHLIEITLIPAECLAGFAVAVADDEVGVDMLTVGMDGEQYIVTLIIKEPPCKFRCDTECLLITEPVIVIWMKGNAHLIGKIAFPISRLSEQAAGEQDSIRKVITVTVKRIVQVLFRLDNTLRDLFRISPQDVIARPAQLLHGFAGLVIDIHVTEHRPQISDASGTPKSPP